MKKFLLITLASLLVCGLSMAQTVKRVPMPSDGGGESSEYSTPWGLNGGLVTDALQTYALPGQGATSANTRCPGNTFNYQRTEYLITAAEMAASGFPAGYTVDAIGFVVYTAGATSQTGNFKVYLRNTTDVTYTLGTSWTTTGFTQVCDIASWTVPIAVGPYVVPFSGGSPFTYTGGGVYVAWEFSNPGTVGTTALVADCNTSLTGGLMGQRSNISMPTTLAASNWRPATIFVNNSINDVINLTNIYTLEKAPIPYGAPIPVAVRASNVTASPVTFNVILTVRDATNTIVRYTSTQPLTVAANSAALSNFTWTPTIQENVVITATTSAISGETWVINNTVTQNANVNNNLFSYDYDNTGASGFGFTYPGTGLFASKFTMHGTGTVPGANLMIADFAANVGNTIYAVVMNSAGTILSQSPDYVIQSGDLNANKNFSFATPPTFTNEDFYIALAQTAGTAQYYPMGTFDESPPRDNTFYTADLTGGATLAVLPSTFGLKYGIEAQVAAPSSTVNPSAFAATPISTSQINLSWLLNPSSNNVLIAWSPTGVFGTPLDGTTYSAGGSIPGGGTVLQYNNSTSFSHTGLTAATTYYYKAWSYSGTSYSTGTSTYATTFCNPTTAPFTEDFEATVFPPACWSLSTGAPAWTRTTLASGYGSGTASATADFYNISATTPFNLITLQFNAASLTNPTLKFDYAYATYIDEVDQLDVWYSNNNGITYSLLLAMPGGETGILNTGGVSAAQFVPSAAQWASQSLALPAGTNKVKFTATSAYGNSLYLDNVKVVSSVPLDAAALSIDMNDVISAGSVSPMATVKNEGTNTITFNVTMTIGAYSSTQSVTSLGPGLTQQVTFAPWAAAIGDYTATVSTALAGDMNAANNSINKPIKVLNLNKQVYGYNAYPAAGTDPEGPTTFNLSTPGILNSLADQSTLNFVSGGSWANGIWYGTVYNTVAPYEFISLDPVTGARTVIGDMGIAMNGLSYNPANSTMYAVTATDLYTINLTTGTPTLVGSNSGISMLNLAINNEGMAYSVDAIADVLGTINLTTGVFTPVGSVGFNANYAQDMEFDRESGDLYMAAQDLVSGWLAWVNTATGAALKIGDFEGGAEITGFAIPYTAAPPTKTINLTGVLLEGLYAGGGTMNQANDDLGPKFGPGIADAITVELHNAGSYFTIEHTATNVELSTTGTATVTDIPATLNGSYYITVKHRNSVEVTTASPVSFAGSIINQSFATPADVYGGNLLLMFDMGYAIYGGDVTQDGYVDTGDVTIIDNDQFNFTVGYVDSDVNGDGFTDTGDVTIVDNNQFNFVGAILP